MDVLISAGDLATLLENRPKDLVLLDIRWKLGDPDGHAHYLAGHLPGAVFVPLEEELAAPAAPALGRHPLPDAADLQAAARRWGLTDAGAATGTVVVYDDWMGLAAARAWWLLRWAGVRNVRILDGGLAAWRAAGGELRTDEVIAAPGDVVLGSGELPILDADATAALAAGSGVVLDARAGERYRGETEPLDPVAGHIPGALSAPTTGNVTADGTFRPVGELRERFAALGIGDASGSAMEVAEVGVYCGSGITASHEIAALAIAGIEASLYPGSWSQWSHDASRPVATGE